jgi:hypothetical protein
VRWNTTALTTTFVSAAQLTAAAPATLIAAAGTATVTVLSGNVTTGGVPFTINAPAPAIASLTPNSAAAGGAAFTLTVNGSNFVTGAVVHWNTTTLTTTFVSATQLTASVPATLIATAGTATVTVVSGSTTSNGLPFAVNPAPAIQNLNPSSATAGGAGFTLTVTGSGFAAGAVVQWNGSALATNVQSATQLTAPVSAALIASSGTASVTVNSGGATSNSAQFTISAAPAIATLNPNSATAGGPAFTLAVTGSNFAPGAAVQWNGSALATVFVSATQLTAAVSASLIANPGTVNITVTSGGGNSSAAAFVILNGPTISSLSPNVTTAGGAAFTLRVNGSGYTAASVVNWNGTALQQISLVNPNMLTASVAAALIATSGTASVTVNSGGVTSNSAQFTIGPGPALNSLSPPVTTAGGAAFTLTVNGSGFGSDASVQSNGTALTTTFVNASQLTAPVSADLIASAASIQITVVSGGVTSNALTFDVANGPALSSSSPGTATAGGGPFTLTLNGTGFTSAAAVQWNGTNLATTFVKATQLTAAVPASLIASAGTAQITVVIDGVSSNALSFVVSVLAVSSLGPATGTATGQPFTLTVNGSGFSSSSVVEWNGTPLSTTFGSANQLTAAVPGNLSQNPGSAQVSVISNGVTSNPIAFALVYPLSSIALSGLAATTVPTQPLSLNLQLASAAPTDLQGVLTLGFVPNAAGVPATYMDPALQFASGGTTFSFAIKGGTTSPAAPIPNIQQGTVAGQITVTLTSLSAGNLPVLPAAPVSASVTVPPIAPVVESCAVGTIANGAFSVQLDAYSTPRDLASATYTFTAAAGAQITVTAANGGQVTGTTQISVPVTTQLSQWFAGSTSQPNGSVFSLQAPFTLSGDPNALQSVSVALTNSIGASAQSSCTR